MIRYLLAYIGAQLEQKERDEACGYLEDITFCVLQGYRIHEHWNVPFWVLRPLL